MSAFGNAARNIGERAYAARMAISDEERKLQQEARAAILKSVAVLADKAPNHNPTGAAELLRAAAEAYAIAADRDSDEPDVGGTF